MATPWYSALLNSKNVRHVAVAFAILVSLIFLFRVVHPTGASRSPLYNGHVSSKLSTARQNSLQSIQNATLGFEGILAINLPERTDHRDGLVLASAVSNMHIEFSDGVHADTVLDKVLPPQHADNLNSGVKGSWRAHVNAIRRVVENGWSSALIMEDDVDWDIRLRSQLQDVALATDYVLRTGDNQGVVLATSIPTDTVPKSSPYGDGWDVIWLGHCGMELPEKPESTIVLLDDETVPEVKHLKSYDVTAESPMIKFPPHKRAIMKQHQGTCSLAYAVSQIGARKLLLSLGLRRLDYAFDLMLRDWCAGANGHEPHVCIGVLPQLFDHHRRVGPNEIDSDISASNGQNREKAYTNNIRWSVRLNMDKLLNGDLDYLDQYPDST